MNKQLLKPVVSLITKTLNPAIIAPISCISLKKNVYMFGSTKDPKN